MMIYVGSEEEKEKEEREIGRGGEGEGGRRKGTKSGFLRSIKESW